MPNRRIIPCLDVKDGKVVKGINFLGMKDLGSPPKMAEEYCSQGADEVTFLDISASLEKRKTILDLVAETAKKMTVPLSVGGGMRNVDDIGDALAAGADKVSINSAAVGNPGMITEASEKYGKKKIIIAIDAKMVGGRWEVFTHGGLRPSGLEAVEWAKKVEQLGAGEILLTSIDADGAKTGYDIPMTKAIAEAVKIPVTASGGCGKIEDFYEVFSKTKVSAALAASVFHYKQFTVYEVKDYLKGKGVQVK